MSCPAIIDPACLVSVLAGRSVGAAAGGVIGGVARSVQSAIGWEVSGTISWWVQIPSPDLAGEPAVGHLQRWLLPVTVAVAVGALLVAAGRMAFTRKSNPLADAGIGVAVIAATSAVGVLLPAELLKAGDAWSSWVLTASTGGQFGGRLGAILALPSSQPVVVVLLGVVVIVMTTIQAVLMLFRQAAVVVLAGVLPLAAAGTLAPATRSWFRRVTSWMLALIFYKPAAAAVYATAFTMIGRSKDPRVFLAGLAMLLLSLVALPVLMKFFTWTTGSVDTSAGGGLLGTALTGAIAVGAIRGSAGGAGGWSAAGQARLLSAQLGSSGSSDSSMSAAAGGVSAAGAPPSGASSPTGSGSAAGRPTGGGDARLPGAGMTAAGGGAGGLAAGAVGEAAVKATGTAARAFAAGEKEAEQ